MLLEAGKQSRWEGEMGALGQEKRFLTLERKSGQAPRRRQDLSWSLQHKQRTGALAEGTARAEGLWQRAQPGQRGSGRGHSPGRGLGPRGRPRLGPRTARCWAGVAWESPGPVTQGWPSTREGWP